MSITRYLCGIHTLLTTHFIEIVRERANNEKAKSLDNVNEHEFVDLISVYKELLHGERERKC